MPPQSPCLKEENRGAQPHTRASHPPPAHPAALPSDLSLAGTQFPCNCPNMSPPKPGQDEAIPSSETPPTLPRPAWGQKSQTCQKIKPNVSRGTIHAICQQGAKAH